jgi:imidazolonepropionase-like amidohydrolase
MTVAVVGARIFDGSGADPIPDGVVLIEDGRIAAVQPARSISLPPAAERLDATGYTVLPGVVDCHVHCTYRARDMRQHLLNTPTYNVLKSVEILRETLACGVTTARDCGGADVGFRAAIEDGAIDGPRLLVAILMISQTGGHGDYWMPAGMRLPKRSWLPSPVADGVEGVRRIVREVLMMGADFVKICTTGGITSVTDHWNEPQFTVAEIATAVAEASAKHRRVAVHAEGLAGIRNAIAAGIYSLEHGWFLDEACVDAMIAKGIWWVPTLALVPLSVERRKRDAAWSGQQLGDEATKDTEIYNLMQKQIPLWRDAVRRGIKVAMGTDQSHRLLVGENLVELEFMVRYLGMTPVEALVAATSRASECLERSDIGLLAPGRCADLIVVDGDPLNNIAALQARENIKLVMKGGKIFANRLQS